MWLWKTSPPPSPPPDEVFLVASVRVSVQKFKETEIQQSNIRGIPYFKNVVAWSHSVAPNNPIGCCWHISLQDGYTKGKHWGQHIQFSCELISGWTHLYCSYTENKKKQEKMFSDLELAIVAFVLVFTLGCIMLERRNNNVRERTPTRKPRKRMRATKRHCDDLSHRTHRGPEENTDEESYNMR